MDTLRYVFFNKLAESGFSYGSANASGMAYLQEQEGNLHTYPQASIFKSDISLPVSPHSELDSDRIIGLECKRSAHYSPASLCGGFTADAFDASFADLPLGQFFPGTYHQPSVSNKEQTITYIKKEENDLLFIPHNICSSGEMNLGVQEGSLGASQSVIHHTNADVCMPNVHCAELNGYQDTISKCDSTGHCSPVSISRNCASDINGRTSADLTSGEFLPPYQVFLSHENHMVCRKDERGNGLVAAYSTSNHSGKGIDEAVEKSLSTDGSYDDSDDDICILEEDPRHPPQMAEHEKSYAISQRSTFSEPLHHPAMGGLRLKEIDERLTFHAALQVIGKAFICELCLIGMQ